MLPSHYIKIHDHGFVGLVDHMGSDAAIVEAARVSYQTGTKATRTDRALIRYLMRHKHTSPLEMCEVKLHIRAPIFVLRQWIRHRTACLSGDTELIFDLPARLSHSNRKAYPLTVAEVYRRFQPTVNATRPDKQRNPFYRRDRVQQMHLRSCNEDTMEPTHTRIVDIWQNGVKPLIRVEFANGDVLRATADHLCLTDNGWLKLGEALEKKAKFARSAKSRPQNDKDSQTASGPYEDEDWRPIPGWENYEASDKGRIRSWRNTRGNPVETPLVKTQTEVAGGYKVVSISRKSKSIREFVHRLVLAAFGKLALRSGLQTRHLDHNPANNHLENLAVGSAKENSDDRMNGGGCHQRLAIVFEHAVSWREDGEEMTYDISVVGPHHNFSAANTIVHNSVNEESGRYSEIREMFFSPALGDLAPQSLDNKQGREGEFPLHKQKAIRNVIEANNEYSYASYKALLGEDLARELARITLPLTAYSSLYWKIDLHNLLHFLTLRTDSHAQKEIRDYADAILEIIRPLFPYAVEAWEDYQQQAKMLSRMDLDLLAALIRRSNIKTQWVDMVEEARGEKVLAEKFGMSGRELRDFVLLLDLPDF